MENHSSDNENIRKVARVVGPYKALCQALAEKSSRRELLANTIYEGDLEIHDGNLVRVNCDSTPTFCGQINGHECLLTQHRESDTTSTSIEIRCSKVTS